MIVWKLKLGKNETSGKWKWAIQVSYVHVDPEFKKFLPTSSEVMIQAFDEKIIDDAMGWLPGVFYNFNVKTIVFIAGFAEYVYNAGYIHPHP